MKETSSQDHKTIKSTHHAVTSTEDYQVSQSRSEAHPTHRTVIDLVTYPAKTTAHLKPGSDPHRSGSTARPKSDSDTHHPEPTGHPNSGTGSRHIGTTAHPKSSQQSSIMHSSASKATTNGKFDSAIASSCSLNRYTTYTALWSSSSVSESCSLYPPSY